MSRPDADGKLSDFSRTVGEETVTPGGERSNTIATYSAIAPGLAEDGRLHLNQRATTVQNKDSDTKTEWIAQPNPGNPSDGLQVQQKTKYTVQYAASVTQQTKTVQVRDTNGAFSVVSVETQKSDQAPAEQAPIAPSDKPK